MTETLLPLDYQFPSTEKGSPLGTESMEVGSPPPVPGGVMTLTSATLQPVNIVASDGLFYVTLNPSKLVNFAPHTMQLAMWLATVPDDATLIISIVTPNRMVADPEAYLTLMNILDSCKARKIFRVDHYEITVSSYLYLTADCLQVSVLGSLYFDNIFADRPDDISRARAVVSEYTIKLAERMHERGIFTDDDVSALKEGRSFGLLYPDFKARVTPKNQHYLEILE